MRLLSTLLTEMDGLELATGVLTLAATNRPGALDPALLRPGRFDVILYVPPPDEVGRLEALRIHTRRMPLAADVDLGTLAAGMERFTGEGLDWLVWGSRVGLCEVGLEIGWLVESAKLGRACVLMTSYNADATLFG